MPGLPIWAVLTAATSAAAGTPAVEYATGAAEAAASGRPRLRLAAAASMTIIRLKRIRFLSLNPERISLYGTD
jgi:hypothetical protein